ETEAEGIRDRDHREDVVFGEPRVPRSHRRLGHTEAARDPAERLTSVLLERFDDALVEDVDVTRPADRPATTDDAQRLDRRAAQREAIRTTPHAIGQSATIRRSQCGPSPPCIAHANDGSSNAVKVLIVGAGGVGTAIA